MNWFSNIRKLDILEMNKWGIIVSTTRYTLPHIQWTSPVPDGMHLVVSACLLHGVHTRNSCRGILRESHSPSDNFVPLICLSTL